MAPYNGYGSLQDSEQNCRLLLPKPPKKDLRKLVNKDGMILRFVCKFHPRSEMGFAVRCSSSATAQGSFIHLARMACDFCL
jgi:hypothetical protein